MLFYTSLELKSLFIKITIYFETSTYISQIENSPTLKLLLIHDVKNRYKSFKKILKFYSSKPQESLHFLMALHYQIVAINKIRLCTCNFLIPISTYRYIKDTTFSSLFRNVQLIVYLEQRRSRIFHNTSFQTINKTRPLTEEIYRFDISANGMRTTKAVNRKPVLLTLMLGKETNSAANIHSKKLLSPTS